MSDVADNVARAADPDQLGRIAERAARAAGEVARSMFDARLTVERKADGTEVTAADRAAQSAAVELIRRERPERLGDGFVAEEALDTEPAGPGRVCWVIDPIDGTRNYVRGIPCYSASVAAMIDGLPVAGAVFDPSADQLVAGAVGRGVRYNGSVVRVSDASGRRPLVAIPSTMTEAAQRMVAGLSPRAVLRNTGSTALHLALVAAGRFDAALIEEAHLWDVAAGWLMIREAGGVATTPAGAAVFPIPRSGGRAGELYCVAAGPRLHAALLAGLT